MKTVAKFPETSIHKNANDLSSIVQKQKKETKSWQNKKHKKHIQQCFPIEIAKGFHQCFVHSFGPALGSMQ